MKFQPGQRVRFKSGVNGEKWFHGEIVRPLKNGFYLVEDKSGCPPRVIHGNKLGLVPIPQGQVFA